MKTFKTLAACALIAPLTMGATSVYAQERTTDYDHSQEQQRDSQRSADERRGAEGAHEHKGMQKSGTTGQADAMDRTRKAGDKDYHAGSKEPLTRAPENAFHMEWLMGKDIQAQAGDDTVGTVSDVLVDEDGEILAVIIGVGGLLGMGERDVAIPWDSIQHTRDEDGESRFTTSMTQAQLENAPEYDRDASGSSDRDAMGTRQDAAGTRPDATGTRDRDTTTPRD